MEKLATPMARTSPSATSFSIAFHTCAVCFVVAHGHSSVYRSRYFSRRFARVFLYAFSTSCTSFGAKVPATNTSCRWTRTTPYLSSVNAAANASPIVVSFPAEDDVSTRRTPALSADLSAMAHARGLVTSARSTPSTGMARP